MDNWKGYKSPFRRPGHILFGTYTFCRLNLFIFGPSFIIGNTVSLHARARASSAILDTVNVAIKMIGPVFISHNRVTNIISCKHCNILFSKDIVFKSNECSSSLIYIFSEAAYLKVTEGANITFTNNTFLITAIEFRSFDNHGPYIFCGFQYVTLNNTSTVSATHYNIAFHNNIEKFVPMARFPCEHHFHHFIIHCRWIPTSVFYGYNPGVINQQIIQTDQHQLSHHTTLCYCSHNISNCSVDVLGPVYPGQVLQVNLCVPSNNEPSVLYVEAHSTQLPTSACRIAHQTELIQTITSHSAIFNFTIVTESMEMCEIFLTVSP